MKFSKSIIMSLLGFCITIEGWNDFTQRYGPSGHIPTIPLYFKAPRKHHSNSMALQKKIEALEQSMKEMQQSRNRQPVKSVLNCSPGLTRDAIALQKILNLQASRLIAARCGETESSRN